jgi:hypothetical protein
MIGGNLAAQHRAACARIDPEPAARRGGPFGLDADRGLDYETGAVADFEIGAGGAVAANKRIAARKPRISA